MGNRQSKVKKSPHEILSLSPVSTKKEVKDRYRTLILETHPDSQKVHSSQAPKEAMEIMEAYTSIIRSPPQFEFYTEELFREDLRKYAEDFFERICDYCRIPGAPKFSDPDFERFYQIFTNFRTQKEFTTEEEKSEFCRNVRKVARVVRSLDKRINIDSFSVAINVKPPRPKERKVKDHPFNCSHCNKGFHSRNQIIDHFRSRKHFERISMVSGDPKKYIENQVQEISCQNESETAQKPCMEKEPEAVEVHEVKEKNAAKKTGSRQEPAPFRTCAECRIVFSSRSELLMHLKTGHREL
ncbi:DnaJ domain-containing protein [Encephalitozoon hellem]|uniref:DnaJ domain-containing protein n=1 Tax=Encephalitozoon hellem TaxID=27973 RepID=A0ABY8CJG5_ENCHE|nr:DnaJ domain-containing protein [Encephalitozoon hellem]